MIHLIFCLRRLPHLSREEFQRYWRETHAPLVRRHAAALGICRYIQAHTIAHPVAEAARMARGAEEEYDGVAELWFDEDAFERRGTTPEAIESGRRLLEDERRFIDLTHSPIFFAHDHDVIA
ncbi:MAG TPA: EthD domain-containing protein [Candidatus Kryptonia bacterium]|nr:EthD domain-containing protein [Candidatus Kryptonia bacterium]